MPKLSVQSQIESKIHVIRGEKVMLDSDLALLYGVTTGALNQAVGRNPDRFPSDFVFRLENKEYFSLISQNVTSKARGGRRVNNPLAFTEQGVAMLSSVLKSHQAAVVNVEIMRTFVKLRRLILSHEDLSRKLVSLEEKYDGQFSAIFEAIHQLMKAPSKLPKIGFR